MKTEELEVGKCITILEWYPNDPKRTDYSWVGDVLMVKAIDLPFIVVSTRYHSGLSLDTRKITIKELSTLYVEALKKD